MNDVHGIFAVSTDGVIGDGDRVPWHHSGDMKRFMTLTRGHGVLMGAKTYLSIALNYTKLYGVPLLGRDIFIVGRSGGQWPDETIEREVTKAERVYNPKGYLFAEASPQHNIDLALAKLQPEQKLFIAGGASIYGSYLPLCDVIHVTFIKQYFMSCANPVRLDDSLLTLVRDRNRYVMQYEGQEFYNGLEAEYYSVIKLRSQFGPTV